MTRSEAALLVLVLLTFAVVIVIPWAICKISVPRPKLTASLFSSVLVGAVFIALVYDKVPVMMPSQWLAISIVVAACGLAGFFRTGGIQRSRQAIAAEQHPAR